MNAVLLLPSYGGLLLQHQLSVLASGCDALHVSGAPIDQARCYLIEQALSETDKDVFVFVDSDISFTKEDLELLVDDCLKTECVVSGIYVLKNGSGTIVANSWENVPELVRPDGLIPVKAVGMGFCAIHRNTILKMGRYEDRVKLMRPNGMTEVYPFFMPMIYDGLYHGEDYAFCVRAKRESIPILLDHRILVTHWGMQGYKLQQ